MNECQGVRDLLALRPDDRSGSERRRVEAHLATCPDCAALTRTYAEQDRLIRAEPRARLTPAQRSRLLARVRQERRRHVIFDRLSTALGALVAAAALVGLILGLGSLLRQEPQPSDVPAGGLPATTIDPTLAPTPTTAPTFNAHGPKDPRETLTPTIFGPTAQSDEWAIYLADQGVSARDVLQADPARLAVLDDPILTLDDVLTYTWERHEMVLTDEAYERLAQLQVPIAPGLPFVVYVGGEAIYAGAFWVSYSSASFNGIVIDVLPATSKRPLRIQLGYPESPELFVGQDLRADPRIRQVFDEAGKLAPQAGPTPPPDSAPLSRTSLTTSQGDLQIELSISLDPSLASGIVGQPSKDTDNEMWQDWEPGFIVYRLQDYSLDSREDAARIYVYRVADIEGQSEHSADNMANLRQLLQDKPEIGVYPVVDVDEPAHYVPWLPPINASPMMHAGVAYLDFENGTGIRYLTQYAQSLIVANNEQLTYTFQGLTQDGKYYIAAVMPVQHPDLLAGANDTPDGDVSVWLDVEANRLYMQEIVQMLDEAESDAFTPDLANLDAMIHSIEVR